VDPWVHTEDIYVSYDQTTDLYCVRYPANQGARRLSFLRLDLCSAKKKEKFTIFGKSGKKRKRRYYQVIVAVCVEMSGTFGDFFKFSARWGDGEQVQEVFDVDTAFSFA
jgi:hypothetical protein